MKVGDDLADVVGNAAEIAVLNTCINLVDRLDVGLISVGRKAVAPECSHIAEEPWYGITGRGRCRGDRRVAEIVQRAHSVFRRLDRQVIRNSGRRIRPEIGRDLLGRAQAYIEAAGDGVGIKSELCRASSIDHGIKCGCRNLLL